MKKFLLALLAFALAGCASAPPTERSRQELWAKYGNQPIDAVRPSFYFGGAFIN